MRSPTCRKVRWTAFFCRITGFFPGAPGADGHVALVQFEAGVSRQMNVRRIDLRTPVEAALQRRQ